jgi:hypothetical protein
MLRKTRIALAAAFVLASTSVTLAEDGGNAFTGSSTAVQVQGGYELSSRNIRRHHHRRHRGYLVRGARSGSWINRASRVWDGGGK